MSTGGDDQELKIKVNLDTSQSKRQAAEEKESVKQVGKAYSDVYEMIGAAAQRSAQKRDAAARSTGRSETDAAKQVQKTVEDVYDVLGRAAQQSAQTRIDASSKASKAEVDDASKVEAKGNDLTAMFGRFAAAATGLNAVRSMYASITGVMDDAHEKGRQQVEQLLQLKNMLRDIASMTGSQGGSTDAFVGKFLDLRKASGLDNAGARAFVQGFAGSGEAKKGINISPEEYEKAKPMIARFAAANSSGDAGAAESFGNLAGLLLGFRKNQTASGSLQDLTNFNEILKAGVGDNPTLIREAAQQAGAVLNSEGTGIVRDPNQLAALISTASIQRSPGQAGTVVQQANRVLRGFTAKHADLLTGAGITANDDMIGALNKMFAKIQEAEANGIQGDQYLAQGGVEGIEDRNAIMALYSGRGYLGRFLNQAANPMTAEQAKQSLDRTFRADAALQTNVAQAGLDESKMQAAMAQQHIPALRLNAQENLERAGMGVDSPAAMNQDWWRGFLSTAGGFGLGKTSPDELGRRFREEEEMFRILQQKGIAVPDRPDPRSTLGGYSGPYTDWIKNQTYLDAYATATNTQYLGNQVGGMPAAPTGAGRQGNDQGWQQVVGAINAQTAALQARLAPPAVPIVQPGGANNGLNP